MQRENDNLSPSSKGGVKSGNGGEGAVHSPGKNRPGTGKNTAKVLTSSKKTSAAAVSSARPSLMLPIGLNILLPLSVHCQGYQQLAPNNQQISRYLLLHVTITTLVWAALE